MCLDWPALQMFNDNWYSMLEMSLLSISMVCKPREALTEYIFLAHAFI